MDLFYAADSTAAAAENNTRFVGLSNGTLSLGGGGGTNSSPFQLTMVLSLSTTTKSLLIFAFFYLLIGYVHFGAM